MRHFVNKKKYMILLYFNKKIIRVYHNTSRKKDINDKWYELITQKPPRYIRMDNNRGKKRIYELALIYPANKRAKTTYSRDSLGRNVVVRLESEKHRIMEIFPYWKEETIYDYQTKKQIKYPEFLDIFLQVTEIAQIFKLNNKLVLQIDNNIRMFGNKNINDCDRLFDILREDLLEKKYGNFIYVKDVTTVQRIKLYNMLTEMGFSRRILYRHYSY